METLTLLLDPGMMPFTGALMLVAGFLVLELLMMMIGGSLMGDGGDVDGPEFDGPEFDGPEFDAPDADIAADADIDAVDADGPSVGGGGFLAWLGFGKVPFIIWLSGLLTAFGLVGYGIQVAATATIGTTLTWPIAALIALIPSVHIGARFASMLGRLVPKTETSAIRRRSLGGRMGVIVQGTARRGKPAQARVRDGFGNWHYVRVEPVDDDATLPARTEVMIREGRGPILFAIALTETNTKEEMI